MPPHLSYHGAAPLMLGPSSSSSSPDEDVAPKLCAITGSGWPTNWNGFESPPIDAAPEWIYIALAGQVSLRSGGYRSLWRRKVWKMESASRLIGLCVRCRNARAHASLRRNSRPHRRLAESLGETLARPGSIRFPGGPLFQRIASRHRKLEVAGSALSFRAST